MCAIAEAEVQLIRSLSDEGVDAIHLIKSVDDGKQIVGSVMIPNEIRFVWRQYKETSGSFFDRCIKSMKGTAR